MHRSAFWLGPVRSALVALAAFALVLPALGCGPMSRASASFGSLMSLSASFKSSARSSGGGGNRLAIYRDDVRAATVAAVDSGAGADDLLRRIGSVAERNGVSDWEASDDTYRAVGEGLRLAGLDARAAETFAKELAGDGRARDVLLEAFRS
jgi:hypothetical protein